MAKSRKAVSKASSFPATAARAAVGPVGHPEILAALKQAFPTGVFLVARLSDPALRLVDPAPHVFIPDTHIVPMGDIQYWPGRVLTPSRFAVLRTLLDVLDGLRGGQNGLMVWQLGDLLDLWRVGKDFDPDLDHRIDALKRDASRSGWSDVLQRFDVNANPPILRLFGNHDEDLGRDRKIYDKCYVPADPGQTAGSDMLVTHGHRFDPIEDLPEVLKEKFMRDFSEDVTDYTANFVISANPHWQPARTQVFEPPAPPASASGSGWLSPGLREAAPVPLDVDRWNVIEVNLVDHPDANPMGIAGGPARLQDDKNPSLWERAKVAATIGSDQSGYDVSLVVVGHTHNPRIVAGRKVDGSPVVMMDCGGWIGPAFLSPARSRMIHKCTIGVRVGNDLRIYQLTSDPYEWPK